MNRAHAQRLIESLPANAKVIDVGGGASAFPRADYVLDLMPYEARNDLGELGLGPARYTAETWTQWDVCARKPWPFPDQFFDFATCNHLLEDVRDPLWVCSELQRVAKAGYIESPSRILEQSRGIEHPLQCGFWHHRWLIDVTPTGLSFKHKPHTLHVTRDAWVTSLGSNQVLNPKHAILTFEWQGSFDYAETTVYPEEPMLDELCAFAARARTLPDLAVSAGRTGLAAIKREVYWRRLKRGER
jgi:hypothetical protein